MTENRQPRVYGDWAGSKGRPEDPKRCVMRVYPGGYISAQCSRHRGHGKGGLYCKQHATRVDMEAPHD